jgi:hypothetical protein
MSWFSVVDGSRKVRRWRGEATGVEENWSPYTLAAKNLCANGLFYNISYSYKEANTSTDKLYIF